MTAPTVPIEPSTTVDEITNRYPETFDVFSQFGVDICCGGGMTLEEAAARDGVPLEKLVATLRARVEHTVT